MTGYDDGLPYPDPDGDLVDIRITALEARVRDLEAVPPSSRGIRQISTSTTTCGLMRNEVVTVITALCDDGTVWWRLKGRGQPSGWSRVTGIEDDGV